ncbi:MAG: CDGSH iron-sulfur domain-containing protein [Gemmatimonadaceae bacterium]|jgi:3-phenylpropionate/trans-cinnamate dioxygenase ferredoxin subunit|nr:CDGSH iron-sulfur domain-containing protein [Gemmatimonadaceae bacterium]
MPLTITIANNGPLKISAEDAAQLELRDHEGNLIPLPEGKNISLCRCGASTRKPFCDGQHSKIGFIGANAAREAADAQA